MTCAFGNHRGRLARVSVPGFDGKTVMIWEGPACDKDANLLKNGRV